jgi:hypothetical protein
MAFVSDAAGSDAENLYVVGIVDDPDGGSMLHGQGLARIDIRTYLLTPLGDFSAPLAGSGAELTGTGDARLFGFFDQQPAALAQVDRASGATSMMRLLDGVRTGNAWAFSFWGGDFFFYTLDTSTDPGATSDITRLHTATDGSLEVVKRGIGIRIVGAGVSTCAPVAPPR